MVGTWEGLKYMTIRYWVLIDLCDSWDQYGIGFASKIYDNVIGYPPLLMSMI